MKIVGFVEGGRGNQPGLVGVPMILKSISAHGHSVVLLMGGTVAPGREDLVVADPEVALRRKEGQGSFGIIRVKVSTRWNFCPSMLLALQ